MVTQAIMAEELARACASTSVTMLISKLGMLPIMNFASEEIKREYLPRIATGEIQASYCLSEADAGSDVAAMRCRAVRDGDDYVLNRLQVLDHQRRGLGHLHGLRQRRTQAARTGGSRASWSRRTGASSSPSTRTRWDCARRRPARSS